MKQITITYRDRNEPSKTLSKNNLQWYDPLKKEMQYFEGGQLEFKYTEDEYLVTMGVEERSRQGIHNTFRVLPTVTDLKVRTVIKVTDNKIFKKFFDNYLNYNTSDIIVNLGQKHVAICLVPDEEVEDFSYQLERQEFNYEIS